MKTQLTAVEVNEGWKQTKGILLVGAIFLALAIIMATAFKTSDGMVGTNGVIGMIALVWAILTCYFLFTGIYGLIRYGKTGRLINRWVEVTGEPIENFPMSAVERAGLRVWAKKELEKRARAHIVATHSVGDDEHSYKNSLVAAFPLVDIEPSGVPKLAQQMADRETSTSHLKQRLDESKRKEVLARSEYDTWWDLLHSLSYDDPYWSGRNHLLPLHPIKGCHFRNPAQFSAWLKSEDARPSEAELAAADPGP